MRDARFGRGSLGHREYREWAEAALGDARQVYAQRADAEKGDPLVFMPDGEAERFRPEAKSGALICPVPECPSPGLTTRHSTERRDHFVHVGAPGGKSHNATYMSLATRQLLRDWAEGQRRVDRVLEARMDHVSFILVACLSDGSRIALCYVDKRLGADAWVELDDILRGERLVAAWIFALRKSFFSLPDPTAPEAADRTDLILDRPIYKQMRKRGSWPLLINLESEELANVFKPGGGPARRLNCMPTVLDRVQHIKVSRLEDCRLCPHGLATPAINEGTLRKSSGR